MSTTPLRRLRRLRIIGAAVAFSLMVTIGLVQLAEHRAQQQLAAEVHTRVLADPRPAAVDEAFVTGPAAAANRAGVQENRERRRAHITDAVRGARTVLDEPKGKVADEAVRAALEAVLTDAEESVPQALPAQLRGVRTGIDAAVTVTAAQKSHAEGTIEQKRLAAESAPTGRGRAGASG